MTTTQAPTQTELDGRTYQAYLDNDQNKAATARALGVSASAVADRIKRHQARIEQDEAADAAQGIEYAPAEPVTEDPDESLVALLEQGDTEEAAALAAVRAEADQVRAMGSVPNPNEDHAVAIELHAASKRAEAEAAGLTAVTVDGAVVAMVEHHDIAGPVDPEIAGILAAGAAGGLAAAAEQAGEVLAGATEAPAKAEKTLVTECVRCGFRFSRPQARQTCQSDKACQRRQAAKAGA